MAHDNIVKYGIIGLGAYLVADYFGLIPSTWPLANMFAVSGGSGTVVNTGGGTTTSPQGATATSTTKQLIVNMIGNPANSGIAQSTDYWNFWYTKVRGVAGPAPETLFPGVDRNRLYTLDEWWAAMTGAGMSGLGSIAHHVNPYKNNMGGNFRFGDNIRPTGMEMYVKRFGGN